MGLFSGQFANVVEWEEYRDDMIFWKWTNREIKKGSKLIIRPGQDAIFLYNGKIEGIFKDEGEFDIESQIIPFLSTLKGFKFGFNSGMRAEVLFVNTKEFNVRWGTKNPISIPTQSLPGGMPVRSFGNFVFKVNDYISLIDKVAGVKQMYVVDDIKERVIAVLDQLLMKWISKEGKDMFNLQANAHDIANGIKQDLDMQICKLGIEITDFNIESFSYPEEIAKMQSKAASQAMVGDMNKYTQMAMADNLGSGKGSNIAGDMMNIQMGMAIGQQMMNNMNMGNNQTASNGSVKSSGGAIPKFCPNCGTPTNGANFCGNCGNKLS
ncbi:MAG: SPFH domain-containing protein [Lachnospira sp.]